MLSARLGYRWGATQLEASASFWLPARGTTDTVELAVQMFGGALGACSLFPFGAWELGPCLAVEVTRVHAELNGLEAGSSAWARALLGPRLGLWMADSLLLSLAADGLLALHRPRFAAGDHATRPPAAGFVTRVGLSYAFGAGDEHARPR